MVGGGIGFLMSLGAGDTRAILAGAIGAAVGYRAADAGGIPAAIILVPVVLFGLRQLTGC